MLIIWTRIRTDLNPLNEFGVEYDRKIFVQLKMNFQGDDSLQVSIAKMQMKLLTRFSRSGINMEHIWARLIRA